MIILFSLSTILYYRVSQKKSTIKPTKIAKHVRLVNIPKWSKGVRNGKPRCFWQLGTLLGPSGHFWIISDKNDFFAPNGQNRVLQRCFGAKYQFLFEMVQKGPDGPKRVPNVQKDLGWPFWSLLGPFGPLWSVDKPAMFGHFWSKMDHFWAIPSHERSTPE